MRNMSSNGVLGVQGDPYALPALKNVQSIGFLIHLYCTNFCTGTMFVPMVVPVCRRYGTISKCATLLTTKKSRFVPLTNEQRAERERERERDGGGEINEARVELVWDPPWNKEMMSEAAKLELNL